MEQRVIAVRRFNRFYTRQIGVLQERLLDSQFSLTEVRVLYELAHRDTTTAADLRRELGLDRGYLSRMLRRFRQQGLVEAMPSQTDGRQSLLSLTPAGKAAYTPLNQRASTEVAAMLAGLGNADQQRVIEAMATIEELLGQSRDRAQGDAQPPGDAQSPGHARPQGNSGGFFLRTHQPGDMGWVVHRHGVLYAQEYGWDAEFEALVAGIVARFIENFDEARERCFIAERSGEILGSAFLARKSDEVGQLRLLLVEPSARGLGIGRRLVDECIRFAREAGYKTLMLWTNSVLHAARHIYQQAGFQLTREEPHHSFGRDLVGQTWELALDPQRRTSA